MIDPDATPEHLAQLAQDHPDSRDEVAAHPNAYPELVEWIGQTRAAEASGGKARGLPFGLILGLLAVWLVALVGVGLGVYKVAFDQLMDPFDDPSYTPDDTYVSPEAQYIPSSDPVVSSLTATYTHSETWSYTNGQAYSFDLKVSFSDPISGDDLAGKAHPDRDSFTLGSACSFDPQHDAVVVATMSATATTEGFDTFLSGRFRMTELGDSDDLGNFEVEVEQGYSDGAECKAVGSGSYEEIGVQWPEAAAPGQTVTHAFFMILKDYFTPATPSGNTGLLDVAGLVPVASSGSEDSGNYEAQFAPDVSKVRGILLSGGTVAAN